MDEAANLISGTLCHARYLVGCACQEGDFQGEPEPTIDEWSALFTMLEIAIDALDAADNAR